MPGVPESTQPKKMMRVVQINLNHCEAAQDVLQQTIRDERADVVIISEPYKVPDSPVWTHDKVKQAAIWTCGRLAFQETYTNMEGFVRAKINGVHLYSCYARPSWTQREFEDMIDALIADAQGRSPVIIAGDFNAWATEWGSRRTNNRGRALLEAIAPLEVGGKRVDN